MAKRVHYHPNLIFSVGTQVVTLKDVVGQNLVRLNETFRLSYLPEIIDRKIKGTEKGMLDQTDLSFHEQEYERLRAALEEAFEQSDLPEQPGGAAALNDLLVRLRLRRQGRA